MPLKSPRRTAAATRKRPCWPPPSPPDLSDAASLARRRLWQPAVWTRASALCLCLVAVLLQFIAAPARAQADEDSPGAGSLRFRGTDGAFIEAPRLHTQVRMQITGIIARVEVRQQFRNPGDQWLEGLYAFPLPENSAVDSLRMEIGERIVVGEIREKADAQQLYEQARANGQRASVVQQDRPNLFRTAVANIGPHETITISIGYLQIVDQDADRYGLRFPLTITPRYSPRAVAATDETNAAVAGNPTIAADLPLMQADLTRQSVSIEIDLDAGTNVEQVTSTYHDISTQGHGRRVHVRLREGRVAPDHDFELSWRPVVHGEPVAAAFREQTASGDHLLLMFMPPQEKTIVAAPREAIFIIDTSGSMGGESIRQAQAALLKGLDTLTPADRFTIIQFNSTFEYLFEAPVSATEESLQLARSYVRSLQANGGTEMLPALSEALSMPSSAAHLRQILFITDGSVDNEDHLLRMITENLANARLFTIGIGSAPNGYFMRKAAQMGRGTFTYIGSSQEVDAKMTALFNKVTQPVLTDIQLHWPEGVAPEYAPAQIGDLYAGEPVVISARTRADIKGTLSITGRSVGVWTRQLSLQSVEPRHGVAALWARNRISDLMDSRASGASDVQIRGQVLPLALEYQLVSKYTSLVAVDKTPARPVGANLESTRLDNTRPQGSTWPANVYPRTATPAQLQVLAGLMLLLLAISMFCWERRARTR